MKESGENYLETILILKQRNGMVRSVDIANELSYSKPSVSRAMGILKNDGFIVVEADGNIQLTPSGMEKASAIYERPDVITRFLVATLGVDEAVADQDACRIEHVISEETFGRMKVKMAKG